jgi:predicted phosphodiesterase
MALKSEVAREYRTKFPDKPTLALARIMFKENKTLYNHVEDARDKLRYIEGKQGAKHKSKVANTSFIKDEARPLNPYKLPNTEAKEIKPYIVTGYKLPLIISDVHLQFHDINAITTCFDYAKKQKPDAIIINGDLLDFYGLSFFSKDPRKRDFAYELSLFKQFFEILQKTFKAKIIYKFGNHELRYERFLMQKAGELVGVEEFELANIIKARAEGIDIVNHNQLIHANELTILHGHELGRGFFSPVNAARGLQLRAKVTALQGDCHKTSEHTETDLKGTIKTTWSTGCLCGLQAEYAPYNSWNHGFAMIELDSNKKDFQVHNKRIYKGKVL